METDVNVFTNETIILQEMTNQSASYNGTNILGTVHTYTWVIGEDLFFQLLLLISVLLIIQVFLLSLMVVKMYFVRRS